MTHLQPRSQRLPASIWALGFVSLLMDVSSWVAVLCVALLQVGVREPERPPGTLHTNPIRCDNLRRLAPRYWWVVALGAVFTLARFREACLRQRLQQGGLPLAWTPLVLVLMNPVFALGKLSDRVHHTTRLA